MEDDKEPVTQSTAAACPQAEETVVETSGCGKELSMSEEIERLSAVLYSVLMDRINQGAGSR